MDRTGVDAMFYCVACNKQGLVLDVIPMSPLGFTGPLQLACPVPTTLTHSLTPNFLFHTGTSICFMVDLPISESVSFYNLIHYL